MNTYFQTFSIKIVNTFSPKLNTFLKQIFIKKSGFSRCGTGIGAVTCFYNTFQCSSCCSYPRGVQCGFCFQEMHLFYAHGRIICSTTNFESSVITSGRPELYVYVKPWPGLKAVSFVDARTDPGRIAVQFILFLIGIKTRVIIFPVFLLRALIIITI
ncbi:hypothetical protein D3C86_1395560 [compost metagenome]